MTVVWIITSQFLLRHLNQDSLIYITLPFIQLVYFISSEKKLTIHIVQMFHLLSQVFYNLKKFLMMDMLGVGDAININTNKNIRQVC